MDYNEGGEDEIDYHENQASYQYGDEKDYGDDAINEMGEDELEEGYYDGDNDDQ